MNKYPKGKSGEFFRIMQYNLRIKTETVISPCAG